MHRKLYLMAAIFALLAMLALAIDVPVASMREQRWLPGDLRRLVSLAEVFAHGMGVACILLTVLVLDRDHRRNVLRIGTCAFGAGLSVHLGKLSVIRWRPHQLSVDSVWDSFCGWFPAWNGIPAGVGDASDIQSFPSGHTATAVGLAVGLAYYYPQGRWLFALFAVLAATQRIESGAHYPSDTLAGAALACLVSALCFDPRVLGKWFDRYERIERQQNAL